MSDIGLYAWKGAVLTAEGIYEMIRKNGVSAVEEEKGDDYVSNLRNY